MAVTITRTPWQDDDGSGTVGTVINNAEKTLLYNQIDEALAKVVPASGGAVVSGNLNVTGNVAATGTGAFGTQLTVQNATANARTDLYVGNNASISLLDIASYGSTYPGGSGFDLANGSVLYQGGVGGLSLVAGAAGAALRFFTGVFERLRIGSAGEVLVNATTNPFGAQLFVATDGAGRANGCCVQNLSATFMNFFAFTNSAGAVAGLIQQTAATTVAYLTTSDLRLKDDEGRATDLSSLRAVVVHDFRWKADGIRDRGVFAQEAQPLFPRAVTVGDGEPDDDVSAPRTPWMTDYSKFVADLIVGWQQHDAELVTLRAELAALKGMN